MDTTTAEDAIEALCKIVQLVVPKIYRTWNEVGYDDETIKAFGNNILTHSSGLLTEMLREAEGEKQKRLKDVAEMYKAISQLESALNMKSNWDILKNESLVQQDIKLKARLQVLEEFRDKRLEKARILCVKEYELCSLMGISVKGLDNTLPSEEELEAFDVHLKKQEMEINQLKNRFKEMRKSIVAMMEEMSRKPRLEFEKLVCDQYHDFVFSASNMKNLQELHDRIKDELESLKIEAENKRQQLITLWSFLEVPKKNYQIFLKQHSDCSAATINALNKEINRCKELRMANISQFVQKLREEITQWWDICKFSQAQRDSFRTFYSNVFTEDTLTLHELELERIRKFYQNNQTIYELLDKREELWEQYRDIERRAEDPDRLNNRGGQLLAEEKIRNQYNKNRPKIDAQLVELMDAFEEKHGKPFTINGLSYPAYIEQLKANHIAEMEKLKIDRARAKEEKKSAKKTPLSASRRTPGMATSLRVAQTSLKRKNHVLSPLNGTSKNPRLANSENTRPRKLATKVRNSRVSRKLLGTSFGSNKPQKSPRRSPRKAANKTKTIDLANSTASSSDKIVSQYEEFQEHLASRSELRSTLLSEVNGPTRKPMKKPVKTPVKPSRKNFSPITPHVTPKSVRAPEPSSRNSPKITSTPRLTTAPTTVRNKF